MWTLRLLLRLRPRRIMRLLVLYATDEAFRELALGYSDAIQACHRWQDSERGSKERAAEYRRLAEELRSELIDRIEGGRVRMEHD